MEERDALLVTAAESIYRRNPTEAIYYMLAAINAKLGRIESLAARGPDDPVTGPR